jgi:hypothetical protein
VTVDSSEEFTVEVRGVFDNIIDGPNTIHAGLRWTSLAPIVLCGAKPRRGKSWQHG